PSGSNIRSAKLLVPAGGFAQDSSGEKFSPTQFGFCLLLPAILVASRSPSLKDLDVMVKTPCALAPCIPHAHASATPPASSRLPFNNIGFPPSFGSLNLVGQHSSRASVTVQNDAAQSSSPGLHVIANGVNTLPFPDFPQDQRRC